MKDRDFKGIWIPKEIWLNDELSVLEKVLFAEIDSLDGENGCYASNEYFMEFFNVSESTITRGIAKLKSLCYIESSMIGGRTRVLRVVKMTRESSQNDYSGSSKNCVSSIKEKIKNNIDNKSTGAGASSKNHSQVYKHKETLTDDLQSGKDIDEQKAVKKKVSEYDKCLVELDKRYSDPNLYMILVNHLEWSYKSKDPKRIRTLAIYKRRLDELDKLDGDKIAIVQQSINRQWHCFYEVSTQQLKGNTVDNVILESQSRSSRDAKDIIAQRAERNGII